MLNNKGQIPPRFHCEREDHHKFMITEAQSCRIWKRKIYRFWHFALKNLEAPLEAIPSIVVACEAGRKFSITLKDWKSGNLWYFWTSFRGGALGVAFWPLHKRTGRHSRYQFRWLQQRTGVCKGKISITRGLLWWVDDHRFSTPAGGCHPRHEGGPIKKCCELGEGQVKE